MRRCNNPNVGPLHKKYVVLIRSIFFSIICSHYVTVHDANFVEKYTEEFIERQTMQRALFTARRAVAVRNVNTASAVIRQPVFSLLPRYAVRFNTTKAEATEEAKTEEPEVASEPAEPSPLEVVQAQLVKKDKDLADMKNHYARAIADFRNLQESTKKEVLKAKEFALQKFAKDLLESLDNFTLALGAVKPELLEANADVKTFHEGVSMTRTVFEKTLSRHGIEKIDPLGEQFDPNKHEATFEILQPDQEPGTVFHVQQPGYTLNSRVLRPAKVGLVKDTN